MIKSITPLLSNCASLLSIFAFFSFFVFLFFLFLQLNFLKQCVCGSFSVASHEIRVKSVI